MIKAVILDMDGVISDTQKIYHGVESKILERYGILMSPDEISVRFSGVKNETMFRELFSEHGIMVDITVVLEGTRNLVDQSLKSGVAPIPGAIELVRDLKSKFKLAVASTSRLKFIRYVLSELKLENEFDAIASGEEVPNGKPAPDVFLLAARRLGVCPHECIVIEDSMNGMLGAKQAGMRCVGLVKDIKREYPADLVVLSLHDLSIQTMYSIRV